MTDSDFARIVRKDIRHVTKLLKTLTPEVLVIVPDLLTDEMNRRQEEYEKRDPRLHYHGEGWPMPCTLEHKGGANA